MEGMQFMINSGKQAATQQGSKHTPLNLLHIFRSLGHPENGSYWYAFYAKDLFLLDDKRNQQLIWRFLWNFV